MSTPISNLHQLLSGMAPRLNPGVFVYASLAEGVQIEPEAVVASIRESEGLSVVVAEADAQRLGLDVFCRCAWITLEVHSDLEAVGLTAAFATALGQVGLSCNVIAGAYHDHIFVPVEHAEAAMSALQGLQQQAAASGPD